MTQHLGAMRILPLLLLTLLAATATTFATGEPAKPLSVTAREITPSRPALGVIRWDMFFGHAFRTQSQEMDFLRPEKYHWRAPFFFRRTGDPAHPLSFNPENRPEIARQAMEQEIEFAASAGIDYWAFGHNGNHLNFRDSLHDGLDAYLTASNRDKMPFCIIVNCGEMASFNVYDPPPVTYTEERTQKSWNSFTDYHYRHPGKDTPYGTLWSIIEQQVLDGKFGEPDVKVFPITMSGANGMPRFKPEGGGFPEWDYREPEPGEQAAHVRVPSTTSCAIPRNVILST